MLICTYMSAHVSARICMCLLHKYPVFDYSYRSSKIRNKAHVSIKASATAATSTCRLKDHIFSQSPTQCISIHRATAGSSDSRSPWNCTFIIVTAMAHYSYTVPSKIIHIHHNIIVIYFQPTKAVQCNRMTIFVNIWQMTVTSKWYLTLIVFQKYPAAYRLSHTSLHCLWYCSDEECGHVVPTQFRLTNPEMALCNTEVQNSLTYDWLQEQ